jgi:MYXO-CTERM domain-containing protein
MRRLLTCVLFIATLFAPAFASAASTTLVISEFRTRGANGANDEFIEIFNISLANINVGGFSVMSSDASGTTTLVKQFAANTVIPTGHYYLLVNGGSQGYSGSTAGDATYTFGVPDEGGIAILNGATVIDAVGMSAGSAYKEGTPLAPMTTSVNQSYERNNGGCAARVDTDNNAADFRFNATSSGPQNHGFNCATATCAGIICKSPPNSCYASTGTCSLGACTYAPFSTGATCSDGNACTVGDTCDATLACTSGPVTGCTTPPADFCSNATTLVTHPGAGTCSPTTGCSYTATDMPCPFGCNGTTKQCNADPCTAAVSCNTAPNGCYNPAGTCINDPASVDFGKCHYTTLAAQTACSDSNACTVGDACDGSGNCVPGAAKPIDDSEACTIDACNTTTGAVSHTAVGDDTDCDDGDKCNGLATCKTGVCTNSTAVTCNTPPAGGCYAATGTCNSSNGICAYQPSAPGATCNDAVTCTTGDQCDGNGLCSGSAVQCPPGDPTCVDANTSRTFSPGACQAASGTCSVVSADKACAFGCDTPSGLCKQDPCIGVTCDKPPTGGCYQPAGTCGGNGVCSYLVTPDAACDDGDPCSGSDKCSAAGKCAGTPLACNTAPAPVCKDANTSTQADVTGTCTNAVCKYDTMDVACNFGCDSVSGLCKGDPCIGVTCDNPTDQCHQATGTCAAGKCTYELKPAGSTCDDHDACTATDVCSATGACAGQPESCNAPPMPTCASGTSTSYNASGTCQAADGSCKYDSIQKACAIGCDATSGLCQGDKCKGVTCDSPTGGVCYAPGGTCTDGTCSYGFREKGVTCNDGDDATQNDVCDGKGKCAGTTAPVTPDGGVDAGAGGAMGTAGAGGRPSGGSAGIGGASGTGTGGKPSSGGSIGDGGSVSVDGGTVVDSGKGGTTIAGGGGGGSCGCSVPRKTSNPAWPLGFLALSVLAVRRRRR